MFELIGFGAVFLLLIVVMLMSLGVVFIFRFFIPFLIIGAIIYFSLKLFKVSFKKESLDEMELILKEFNKIKKTSYFYAKLDSFFQEVKEEYYKNKGNIETFQNLNLSKEASTLIERNKYIISQLKEFIKELLKNKEQVSFDKYFDLIKKTGV